ncbi:MAG TPA: hypothetical protein VMZ92_10855 [Planctomycetota bacterium]|nr:hypothetical protein [Planctomycetota bacterium]
MTARLAMGTMLAAGAAVLLLAAGAAAETIAATQVDAKTIRVVVPGKFETDFTLRKGFGATWFNLKHDPDKKRDLAPVADENGFFWIKAAPGPERPAGGASWYANPSKEMELLEAGPVRVRVRLKGKHMRYGKTDAKAAWEDLDFELTWTVYPTGHVFGDYALIAEKPVTLHHVTAIIKSTGHWGPNGKGEGAKEAHCASEAGDEKPSKWTNKGATTSFALQWSNGPTYFTDVLMAFQKGKFYGSYWNEGYEDKDYRAGLDVMSLFKDATVPAGTTHVPVMFRIADDMNDADAAALHANDYRSPDRLEMTKGQLDKTDPGDVDGDGYNEAEGCYVLKAAPDGVVLKLHGKETPRMNPVFKVKGWNAAAPKTLTLNNRPVTINGSVRDGVLLLQVLEDVKEDVTVALTP